MAHQNAQKFPSLFEALYCNEEQWEEEVVDKDDSFKIKENACTNDDNINNTNNKYHFPNLLLEKDLPWEEDELNSLFDKEKDFDFCNVILAVDPLMAEARSEAVEWMLKVTNYYSFSAVTALLAVSYLDRFLFGIKSNSEKKPWMTQLAAVSCLSLAAKVEETRAPILLHLQVEECKYVFEAKTIQRMEILLLSTFEWKMYIATPLSFVDYVIRRLCLTNIHCWKILRRCECLLLSIISDCRFISYLPSTMAVATMLHVFSSGDLHLEFEYHEQILRILLVDKDKLEECYRLMSEVTSTNYMYWGSKRKYNRGTMPRSPNGVMDISFSSDSSIDSWASIDATSVSSSPRPLSKRARVNDQLQLVDDGDDDGDIDLAFGLKVVG